MKHPSFVALEMLRLEEERHILLKLRRELTNNAI